MNIETANRLYELRKKNNLSQEEVADKLGISRQSVSKWERAESSPDTDNLIELAKLYNVSLDELLNVDNSSKYNEENKVFSPINAEEFIKDDEEDETNVEVVEDDNDTEVEVKKSPKLEALSSILWGSSYLLVTIAYLLLGFFTEKGWSCYWVLFLLPVVVNTFIDAIIEKKASSFAYPVLVTMVFLFIGMRFELWHPLWVLFITIPVYYIIVGTIEDSLKKKKRQN